MMGVPCAACHHPRRDELDSAIVAGQTLRAIGKKYGMSASAVLRHRDRHLSPALAAMEVEREQKDKATALEEIWDVISSMKRVLAAAEQEGKPTLAVSTGTALGVQIERMAKLAGQWQDQQPTVVVNVQASEEWQQIRAVILAALMAYPEARQAVAGRLLQLEAGPS
jgi:hypothetical protein